MSLYNINYLVNTANDIQIYEHLLSCSNLFIPPLFKDVNIKEYSIKIKNNAITIEAWEKGNLIGLIAVYLNDLKTKKGFITNVSILKSFQGKGISSKLLKDTIDLAKKKNFKSIKLSVQEKNIKAIRIYEKHGFAQFKLIDNEIIMKIDLNND